MNHSKGQDARISLCCYLSLRCLLLFCTRFLLAVFDLPASMSGYGVLTTWAERGAVGSAQSDAIDFYNARQGYLLGIVDYVDGVVKSRCTLNSIKPWALEEVGLGAIGERLSALHRSVPQHGLSDRSTFSMNTMLHIPSLFYLPGLLPRDFRAGLIQQIPRPS